MAVANLSSPQASDSSSDVLALEGEIVAWGDCERLPSPWYCIFPAPLLGEDPFLTVLPAVLHFHFYSTAVSLVVGERKGTLAKILIKPPT